MTQSNLKPSTERMRRLNERRKAGITLPKCKHCGAKCTSPEGIKLKLCSACRRKTDEGRKKAIANAYRAIHRKARLEAFEGYPCFEWDWKEVSDGLPTHIKEVLVETIRKARTTGIYYPEYGWVDTIDGETIKAKRWAEIVISKPDSEAS